MSGVSKGKGEANKKRLNSSDQRWYFMLNLRLHHLFQPNRDNHGWGHSMQW